jgi:hypothetical protein
MKETLHVGSGLPSPLADLLKLKALFSNLGVSALQAFFLVSISATLVVVPLLSRRPIYFTL